MAQESVYRKLDNESDLRNILDDFYAKAKQAIEQGTLPKFKNLLEISKSEPVILTAIHNIKRNHGSMTAGTDGKTIRDVLEKQYPEVIQMVHNNLDNYQPQLLRRVWIPKPGKTEKRPLGIPAIVDRVIQEILRIILEPILEAQFFSHFYGFRPMRDAHVALERVTNIAHDTGYHWIIEGDIKGCFDHINHTRLIKQLWHMGIHDRRVLMIIKKMLKAGVMEEMTTTDLGTPQGGIISPLLANAYLHKLDQWIIREWENKRTRTQYARSDSLARALKRASNLKPAYLVRYADDWVLVTNTKSNAKKWKHRIQNYLGTKLKLTLSAEKTLITNVQKEPIHFLGFRFKQVKGKSQTGYITITRPNDKRLKAKVQEIRQNTKKLRKSEGVNLIHAINVLNSQIAGIGNYYQAATRVNEELNKYANRLQYTAYKALKPKGGKWTPANTVNNLTVRHAGYATQIPAITYEGITVGITSLGFVKWQKARLKTQQETPYSVEGRQIYAERTAKKQRLPRDDLAMNLTLSEMIAKGLTDKKYNFEYLLNRAYAYNHDKGVCRICGEWVDPSQLEMHHSRPWLPLDKINKVNELVTLHRNCHDLVHSKQDLSQTINKKVWTKIQKLREKLNPMIEKN